MPASTYWLTGDPTASAATPPVLEVKNLTLRRGPRLLFADPDSPGSGLTFSVHAQTINVLEAPNGWGKSSLLDRLIGLIPSETGTASVAQHPIPNSPSGPSFYRAGGRALVSTHRLYHSLTMSECAALSGPTTDMAADQHRNTDGLSGGESRWLGIDLLSSGIVTILDEYSHSLNLQASAKAVKQLRGEPDIIHSAVFEETTVLD